MNRIFIALLSIICFSFLSFGQQANLKSNFLDTTNLNNITSILDYENQIMSMVDSLSTEDLIDYYKKGLSACQAIQNDTLARIFADNTLRMYLFENDMTNMEKYARIALVHSENSGKAKLIAYQHLTLATSFLGADNVTAAIEEFLKVIEISNHHEVNKEYEYSALMSLGFSFYLLGEIEQSMLYLKSAERFFLENENKHKDIYLANIYVGIAGGFFDQENKDSSDFYINQTILALQRVESDTSLNKTQVETIIADIYFDLIEYALLEDKIFEAGIYYDKIKDFKIFDRERKYIIEVEFFLKKNELEKVEELISNPPEELPLGFEIDLLKSTASYYEKIGNHKKSLSFFKQYNEKKVAQMKSQQIKFSTYTKERIESVNQKGEIEKLTQEKTFQSKLNKVSMFILACLGGTIALLIYVFFQARTKNRLLNKNIEDEKTIKLQLQQIQQVEHEKNKLFTNIAHELQTPLSIIQGLSKRLYHSNELTGDTGEALQIINKNSRYLSEKTNQILSIDLPSQDDSSSGFLWFSLSHLLEYVLPEFYFLAEEKSIKIHEMDDFDSEIFIYSDVNRITTILKNILSNAIKYTNKNGSISIRRAVKNSDYYEIIIEDTGRGIAEEKLPNIFDRYYQVSTEAEGGFGLGLAICQEYIKSLKGKIEVTSTLGKGSSFFIQIPKIIPDDLSENREIYQFPQNDFLKQKALDKKTESTAHTEHHLLIVEDNIDIL